MYIALIIQDMYCLGAQYVTALIAYGLAERGHKVDLIVSAIELKIAKERPELEPFQVPEVVNKIELPFQRGKQNIWAIRCYLKKNKPDVIVPMSSNYELPVAVALSMLNTKTKLIPVEHSGGIGMNLNNVTSINWIRRFIDWTLRVFFYRRVDHIIAVSKGVKEALIKVYKYAPEKISVIYNPVIGKPFFSKFAASSRHPWLRNKELPVIISAGAHVPLKRYDILLKAFAKVIIHKPCRLIIYGEGKLTETLKDLTSKLLIEEFVSFPGFTQNLPAELKNANGFVVSSQAESFSIVLVEALACGLPVVSTKCPSGPLEILHNGKYGIMVELNDPDDLARGILDLLNGKNISPPKESWEPYRIENVVMKYEEIFEKYFVATRCN